MEYYINGLVMGMAYVMPIGVQNMFVINTALTQRRRRVFATALIVSFFDITLGMACFFGAGAVISSSLFLEKAILLVGSAVVIMIGAGLLRPGSVAHESGKDVSMPLAKVVATACVVTWFNPQAIVDGTMMLGAFRASLPQGSDYMFAGGFASASLIWFTSVSALISVFSAKITDRMLRMINIVCGAVITFYGIKLFMKFISLCI